MKRLSQFFIISLFLFVFVGEAFAQESTVSSMPIASPTPQASSYVLPYPGILPNSPFYFLKTTRDRVISFLISDPVKKAEFDVLQADKRLNAAISLFKLGNQSLAETTIAKGENYFDDAFSRVAEAKKQGMDVNDVINKLSFSLNKHGEVLRTLQKKSSTKSMKSKIDDQIKRIDAFEKRLSMYIPKKKK